MAEVVQAQTPQSDPQEIGPAYMLGHPDIDDLIVKSGGIVSFTDQLAEELETMYGDKTLWNNDRFGFTDGFATSEWMECRGPDYRVGKWISSSPEATPTVNGSMFLWRNGEPGEALICDSGFLTAQRTAGTTALVINKLRPDLETLSVIGAGQEGQEHAFVIALRTSGLRRVMFRDIVFEHAESAVEEFNTVAEYLHKQRGTNLITAEAVDPDDRRLELESDAIVTATMATQEVLTTTQLKSGIVLAAVGGDMVGKRELGSKIYNKAKFVADDLKQSLREGELQHAARVLRLTKRQKRAAQYHGSLMKGRVIGVADLLENPQAFTGRREPITIYDSTGFSGQDLAVGRLMMRLLEEQDWPKVQFHPPRSDMSFSELMGYGRRES